MSFYGLIAPSTPPAESEGRGAPKRLVPQTSRKKVSKYLQKLGKALMLPVAALPVAGILMGVGYLLAPGVMGVPGAETAGAAYTAGFLLITAGGALIDNMAWLFAIGAAVGLADDHDGTAGLAGLVAFLMIQ